MKQQANPARREMELKEPGGTKAAVSGDGLVAGSDSPWLSGCVASWWDEVGVEKSFGHSLEALLGLGVRVNELGTGNVRRPLLGEAVPGGSCLTASQRARFWMLS